MEAIQAHQHSLHESIVFSLNRHNVFFDFAILAPQE
jgi:hypothetical protein